MNGNTLAVLLSLSANCNKSSTGLIHSSTGYSSNQYGAFEGERNNQLKTARVQYSRKSRHVFNLFKLFAFFATVTFRKLSSGKGNNKQMTGFHGS